MPDDELDILLIEDNPGDARLIEEMLAETEGLLQRVDVGRPVDAGVRVHHEQHLEAGLERLEGDGADVVLLDLGLPESTGLDTLATVVEATEFVPVVVLTGLRDETVGIEAIQHGAQDYLVKGEVTGDLLVRSIHHAIERNRQERERAEQLQQLEALNRLNRISQEVTHAVITTSTRADLERAVCERVVAAEDYRFAWIGAVDRATDRIEPRASAGAEQGYLDDITVPVGDETTLGPAGEAVRTHEVQVVQDMQTDPDVEPWREKLLDRGYRSGVVVPIVHEDLLYGVMCLYSGEPTTISEPEIEILSRLGDVVGHAITAIERKDALVSDTVLELEFEVADVATRLVALTADGEGSITFEKLIHNDGTIVAFGRSRGISPEVFRIAVDESPEIDAVSIHESDGEANDIEVVTSIGSELASGVATRGGVLSSVVLEDGEGRVVVRFPPGLDKRGLVELVTEHCPGATPTAQRTVQREDRDALDLPSVLQERLTGKQRTALEIAHYGGYFEWPRDSTSEELADRLGVSPATFTHHLRAAERSFFEAVFAAADTDVEDVDAVWTSMETE